ncbi:hypothetical protein Ancab_024967 [Ancistrocladus abbreviatus]
MPTQTANPLNKNPTLYTELAQDSSLAAGPLAVSGAELTGPSLLEGKTPGASAGVVELEGTLTDPAGVAALAGISAPTGGVATSGALTGVTTGGGEDDGFPFGAATGVDPLGDWLVGEEMGVEYGEEAGDITGDACPEDGLVAGETVGVVRGDGEEEGDFDGDGEE